LYDAFFHGLGQERDITAATNTDSTAVPAIVISEHVLCCGLPSSERRDNEQERPK
jgi:hypothetical protein